MSSETKTLRGPSKSPIVLKFGGIKTDTVNHEGYRMIISCCHDKSKTGSKAQATKRL